jgi:hypothetical protein
MPRKAMATFKRLVAPIAGNTSNHDNKVYDICRGVAKERGVIDFQVMMCGGGHSPSKMITCGINEVILVNVGAV